MRIRYRPSIVIALLLAFLLGACQSGEEPESSYADYREAAASGLIERGWIPDWLPETAVSIREKHNLDSNASILLFDAGADFLVPEGCEPDSDPPAARLRGSWWPESLPARWPAYSCGDGYLAVDAAEMNIYFWRP